MINKPIYLAASLLAILSVIAIGASGNTSVFAQSVEGTGNNCTGCIYYDR